MFYEKLAEAKKENRSNLSKYLATGAAAAAGGYGASRGLRRPIEDFVIRKKLDAIREGNKRVWDLPKTGVPFRQQLKRIDEIRNEMRHKVQRMDKVGKGLKYLGTGLGAAAAGYGTKKLIDLYGEQD